VELRGRRRSQRGGIVLLVLGIVGQFSSAPSLDRRTLLIASAAVMAVCPVNLSSRGSCLVLFGVMPFATCGYRVSKNPISLKEVCVMILEDERS